MIDELRQQLWEAQNLNPLWPAELLENAKDPNYEKVNFSYHPSGSKVEMTFWDEGELIDAVYYFDQDDFLQRAIMIEYGRVSVIYDRKQVVNNIVSQLLTLTKNKIALIA